MVSQLQQVAVAMRIPEDAANGGELSERQYHLCRAICAFGERAVDIAAQTDGRLLPLVQVRNGRWWLV